MPGGVSKSTQGYGGKFTIRLFINLFIPQKFLSGL